MEEQLINPSPQQPPTKNEIGSGSRSGGYHLTSPKLFLQKTIIIIICTYVFIPLILLHNAGDISSILYAGILVGIHILFIVIYFWKVYFRKLDNSKRALAARVLGLVICVCLLALVAGHLESNIGRLALDLAGLCVVHTLILGLLMIRSGPRDSGDGDGEGVYDLDGEGKEEVAV